MDIYVNTVTRVHQADSTIIKNVTIRVLPFQVYIRLEYLRRAIIDVCVTVDAFRDNCRLAGYVNFPSVSDSTSTIVDTALTICRK